MSDLEHSFRATPPTPEEFLTERYIGNIANYLFPHIREAFIETFKGKKKHVVLVPNIGWGKSMYVILCNLYMNVLFAYEKNPYRGSPSVRRTQVVVVPKMRMEELVVNSYLSVLEKSPFFREVDYDDYSTFMKSQLLSKGAPLHLCYTRESKRCQLRFTSGIDLVVTDNPKEIAYFNPISVSIEEVAFFDEERQDCNHVIGIHRDSIDWCNLRYRNEPVYGMTFLSASNDYHPEIMKPYLFDLSSDDKVKIVR